MDVIERFKTRKNLSQLIDVKFVPSSAYVRYADAIQKRIADLTEEDKKQAASEYNELVFTFSRLTPVEARKWDLEILQAAKENQGAIISESYFEFIQRKLSEHFKSAIHTPSKGEKIEPFDQAVFDEFCGYLSYIELIELSNAYREALRRDEEHAAENPTILGADSKTRSLVV